MLTPGQIAQEIATLPESAQILLLQLIQLLKQPPSTDQYRHLFQLSPTESQPNTPQRRQRGSAQGQIWMAPDFNEPLSDFQDS
jgi:hypothetical protein